jgi:hypothetical protein
MPILFDCPFCSYEKDVPDSYNGKKIKCPRCLATLTLGVPQPTALTALPLPEDDVSPLEQTAIEVGKTEGLQECPFCFELLDANATFCSSCHKEINAQKGDAGLENIEAGGQAGQEETDEGTSTEEARARHSRIQNIFYLAIASLACFIGAVCGPLALGMALTIVHTNLTPRERQMLNAGMVMGAVGTSSSLILIICLIWG